MTQPPDYGQTPPPSDGGGYGGYGSTPPPPPPPPPAGPLGGDDYSVGDALSYGWRKFTQNAGTIIALALLLLVVSFGVSIVLQFTLRSDNEIGQQVLSALVAAISFVLQTALGALIVRGALDLTEGRELDLGSISRRIPWGKVIVLALLVGAIVFVGFILCFIPGIIAAFLLSYATYFLLDKDLEPLDAVKASFGMVKNNVGSALVWAILAFFVGLVGLCFCGVGYLVTYPVALIGTAYTYKKLSGQTVAP